MRIQDVMHDGPVVTVAPDATVAEAVRVMAEADIGAVVVSPDGTSVAGILSERDVVRGLVDGATTTLASTARELMTAVVRTCSPEDTTADLMRVMTRHRVRHVPVVVDDRLVGIVSIGDVVKARIDELAFERDQLDAYVQQG